MKPQETLPIRPKLLVVDDEPDNLDLLYRTFHREYRVLRAENGPEALEILANERDVAVIISDQRMPLMSGTEFLSLTANKYPDIIRIILTGYTDVEDLVDAINAGKVFKFVTKPWNADELKAVVGQAMETHNVLKVRTEELSRALRRESLLNTVTNTIRNAQYGRSEGSPLQQILKKIVATVGHLLEVDICILRPFQDERLLVESFVYQKNQESTNGLTQENQDPDRNVADSGIIPTESLNSKPLYPITPILPPALTQRAFYPPSLEQTVWETREVEVINDVLTSKRFNDLAAQSPQQAQSQETARLRAYQQLNIRSSLIVPLISQQELMAVMALHRCGEPYLWGDDEIQLVVMVADQAALALSQARAYEQVQALATQQALINTITTAIRSTLNPQEIFTAITQQLGKALKVDGCALSLWKSEDEFVQCVGLYDGKSGSVGTEGVMVKPRLVGDKAQPVLPGTQPLPQSIVPISGNPVLQQLLNTQQPVVIDDLVVNSALNGFDLPLREPSRALIVVPLLSDGQLIGSITLRQTSKPRHWLSSEIDLAQAVASQAAIAVQQSRLYQKTRQQAERLLELDRQKTEFFQNISHEFRTPLTLMIGPLESVVAAQMPLSYDQSAIALRNSRRLLRLVNQLLDIQRLDAGRMQASFRPCNFVEFINQIVENFRPYCDRKNITISTQLTPCTSVYLDENFDKVLYNLLSNAMKFTNPGGKIEIKVEPVGNQLRMQVTDTGIGIRHEQIPYLFERFRQAEGSVNRSHEGTGLGLALAKELVELHGGEISVESVYSEGTTFNVLLQTGSTHLPTEQVLQVSTDIQPSRAPIELADIELESGLAVGSLAEDLAIARLNDSDSSWSANSEIDEAATALNTTLTIEVVDDNLDVRTYISRILRQAGYQVITARNGQEGFDVALMHHPDLIVTDLMMPVVSGIDMIRLIRKSEELQGIPIILVTARADEATRLGVAEEGAVGYLSKPFSDRELLTGVRNLLALKVSERRVMELNNKLIESQEFLTKSVLKRFLPPSMVERAARGELSLEFSVKPRLITILFSDIVGFTKLSNTLRSRRVAELLNEYLETMTRVVFDHGGTVDKFMGDAILVLFGAPEELTANEQVRRAIDTARAMYVALDALNERWQALGILGGENKPPLVQFRCGIHQGAAVVGMFGGSERSDYTAIGPAVNIASRLQEAAKPGEILISAEVAEYLEDDAMTRNDQPLRLRGIDETVLTFSVNSRLSDRS
jgi:signal transduction histidine kinase/class 3 adenylate cyclase/DNA-binding response OmpR family regulator